MKHTFLRAALLFIHASGFCSAAGIITGEDVRGVKGESVTFATSLEPSAESFLALTWSFNRTTNIITSTSTDVVGKGYESRIALNKQTGSLVLSNLTEEDSGEYELTIFPYGGQQLQGSATLKVLTLVSKPSVSCPDPVLIEGQSVKLTCDADSFVSRVWTKDGKAVVSGDRFSFHDGNRLYFKVFYFSSYWCRLIADGPEKVNLTSPLQGYYAEGSEVVLTCSASSRPAASFHWFHNGAVHPGTGAELRLMDIQMNQSGNYSCQAFNNRTLRYEASQSAAVNVLGRLGRKW
uniref:Ig-like domain-containing protein n=1 Tax=Takifugu rubripes TaxID=31033 RepID=H2SHA3_TAKRU